MTDPIQPSPKPPDGSGLEHTPSVFPVTTEYVKRKLAETEASRGRSVLPKGLTPWFFGGFTLCGAITTVAMSFEGVMPKGILIAAAVGTMFFGGMLGMGPGLRK